MTHISCTSKNFLYFGKNDETIFEAKKGNTTLILTCQLDMNINLNHLDDQSTLNRIIIMYFENFDKMLAKVLNLHEWIIHPNIVILDLDSIYKNPSNWATDITNTKIPTVKDTCLLICSLHNYISLLSKKDSFITFSITVAEEMCLPNMLKHTFVDLYFYNSCFKDFSCLKNHLPII